MIGHKVPAHCENVDVLQDVENGVDFDEPWTQAESCFCHLTNCMMPGKLFTFSEPQVHT